MTDADDGADGGDQGGATAGWIIQGLALLGTATLAAFLWAAFTGRYWTALVAGVACAGLYATAVWQLEQVGPG